MNEPSIGIGSAAFAGPRDLERIVDSFEEAWQTGAVPRIDSYLSACENGTSRSDVLQELIKVDLEYRWRRPGSTTLVSNGAIPARPTVDDYARTFSELNLTEDAILELVTEEYRVRRRWGDDPDHGEYLRRFPMHAAELTEALVQIRAEIAPDVTWKSDTPRSNGNGRLAHRSPPNTCVIGDHEIIEELGRGGMGVVYKARHRSLDRVVALKMMLSAESASPEERTRFRREAESAARLQHANIVQIHDIGEDAGRPFFSLEYIDGGNLNKHLAGFPQPPLDAARLVMTLAHAIQYAHDRGVVHRDLKPANILLAGVRGQGSAVRTMERSYLTPDPSPLTPIPKITDFGLAKRLDGGGGNTQTGSILGTPSYMAPEQAYGNSDAVGPAADVYALGAILYELLTGRPPFRAASILETLEQVRSQEPVALRHLQPKLPRDIETICLKCLQKDPRRRYSQAADLANDLGAFLAGEPIRARPVAAWERGWKWARRRPAVAALLVTLATAMVVLIVGGWVYTHRLRDAQLQTEKEKKLAEAHLVKLQESQLQTEKEKKLAEAHLVKLQESQLQTEKEKKLAEEHLTKAMQSLEHVGMTVFEKGGGGPELEEFKKKLLTDLTLYFKTFLGNEDHPNPEIRRWTARAYKGLGMSYSMLGHQADAEAAHRSALAMCERLAAESPNSNILRHDLACAHCLLGDARGRKGNRMTRRRPTVLPPISTDHCPAIRKLM